MKINFVTFGNKLTGGTRVIMEVINGLALKGHKMSLTTFGKPEDLDWINLKAKVYYANRSCIQKVFGYLFRKSFGFQCWPEEETRQLIKAMPKCDVNIATISYSGFAVSRSDIGMPFHFYMHYEPLVREDGYKKKIIKEILFLQQAKTLVV